MRKVLSVVLVTLLVVGLAGCSSRGETVEQEQPTIAGETNSIATDTINPLSEKQYEALVIDKNIDFLDFFNSLNQEYSGLLIELSDYVELHGAEIENENMGFSDFADYEETLDNFYRFLNGVMYCDSENVPEEYKDAWSYYKTTIWANKTDLDNLYFLKGQDLISGFSDMLTSIKAGVTLVSDAMPNGTVESVVLGDTISLEFVEISLEEIGISDTILPVDTNRGYSYISDNEFEKYYYVTGVLKNLSGDAYSADDIFAEMIFDGKYTYSANLRACAWSNNFYDDYVKPLGTVKYYIYASIPDELIESYSECVLTFGFADNFNVSKYSLSQDKCDYLYSITINQ